MIIFSPFSHLQKKKYITNTTVSFLERIQPFFAMYIKEQLIVTYTITQNIYSHTD